MNVLGTIVLGGVLSFSVLVDDTRARAIPDFYTDKDLEAWHQFGLRSFYGPWTVIARKPNGDLVSYADYGARIPKDFKPLSSETIDNEKEDDSFPEVSPTDFPVKRPNGSYDFPSGYKITPYGISVLKTGSLNPDKTTTGSIHDDKDEVTLNPNTDIHQLMESIDGKSNDMKRDTLELIGIVGVISDDNDSDESTSTTEDNESTIITEETPS